MDKDPQQKILDAFLKEAVRDNGPPDLKDQILQKLQSEDALTTDGKVADDRSVADLILSGVAPPPIAPVHVQRTPKKNVTAATKSSRSNSNLPPQKESQQEFAFGWRHFAIATGLLVTASLVTLYLVNQSENSNVANINDTADSAEESVKVGPLRKVDENHTPTIDGSNDTQLADNNSTDRKPENNSLENDNRPFRDLTPDRVDPSSDNHRDIVENSIDAWSQERLVQFVNTSIRNSYQTQNVTPASPMTDEQWCNRLFSKTIGRQPNQAELDRFTANASAEKRSDLIEELVSGSNYQAEFTQFWSESLATMLLGKVQNEPTINRETFVEYLALSVSENKPYDQLVRELISATGSPQPNAANFNGATNFLLSHFDQNGVTATSETSRLFLGQRTQCVQCHDGHTSGAQKQVAFWQLNSFFRQMRLSKDNEKNQTRLVNVDFAGEDGNPREAAIFFEDNQRRMQVAYPKLGSRSIKSRSGYIEDVDRRLELAKLITTSDQFAQTTVNRLWAHFLDFGFTHPVDDFGSHNPASHPELLDELATQFKAHRYDSRELIKWIVGSEAFALSNKNGPSNLDSPQLGQRPLFAQKYQPANSTQSIEQSLASLEKVYSDPTEANLARLSLYARAVPGGRKNSIEINPEIVDLTNAATFDYRIEGLPWGVPKAFASQLETIAMSSMTDVQKIDHIFRIGIARSPSRKQLDFCKKMLAARKEAPLSAFQDIWWTIINSSEFASQQ